MEIPHPHDAQWYRQQLSQLTPQLRKRAITGYQRAFEEVCNAHHGEIAQSNLARREANTRLRKFVERYGSGSIFD